MVHLSIDIHPIYIPHLSIYIYTPHLYTPSIHHIYSLHSDLSVSGHLHLLTFSSPILQETYRTIKEDLDNMNTWGGRVLDNTFPLIVLPCGSSFRPPSVEDPVDRVGWEEGYYS